MKIVLFIFFGFLFSACTHTIEFRTSHFASPVTGENQWNGQIAGVASATTKVTVINDITANPPTRNSVEVNKSVDVGDVFLVNNIGFDASLSILRSLDIYVDSSLYGLRWQFLNHGSDVDVWVGAIQGAYGERSDSTSNSDSGVTSKADSKIKTTQAGISLGYKLASIVPYVSYIQENNEISTSVTNGGGNFGPYVDKGSHRNFSVGLSSHGRGILYAIEYNMINITWERAEDAYQNAAGLKLGFAW